MYVGRYVRVLCIYVNSLFETRPNSDSNIEDEVHMTTAIVYVHWCSDHLVTAGINARQAHVKPARAWVSAL
jgi:hypothetical protein